MQILEAPTFQNVGAGLKAIIGAFDRGMSYMGILLECGGSTFNNTHLGEIEIKANGKTIMKPSAAHLLSINKYYNETANAAFLYIPFGDEEARTIDGQLLGCLDTSVLNSLTMTVAISGSAVAPTLKAHIFALPPKVTKEGLDRWDRRIFRTFLDADHAPSSASKHQLQISTGTRGGNLIKAVHYFGTIISSINVKRDGVDMQNDGRAAVINFIQNRRKRTTQANHHVFDPVILNDQSEALPTLRANGDMAPWRFDVVTSAGGDIKTYTEVYATLESI
jgi:hypothetical protein